MIDGKNEKRLIERAAVLLGHPPPLLSRERISRFIRPFINKADTLIDLAEREGSPIYILDPEGLKERLKALRDAFSVFPGKIDIYYAVKSNNMPAISEILTGEGAGLDVSSGRELEMALAAGASRIFFSGPGKTDSELLFALDNSEIVTILIDSFGELERLERLTAAIGKNIRAGVRITTSTDGLWRKFGIPIESISDFFEKASGAPGVGLEGIQFHTSWNLDPSSQVSFIKKLGRKLTGLSPDHLKSIRFIDIGGGYWPEQGEWLRAQGTAEGALRNLLSESGPDRKSKYFMEASDIRIFASEISSALASAIPESIEYRLCLEPGRWLCHSNMHILVTVIDVKGEDIVITDAGTNAIGWERLENDYFPVINLSHPSLEEHSCNVLGSLCTPHDVWGYSYHGSSIETGDRLLIPNQGAYTYSLRQEFIKPLPKVVLADDQTP